MTNKKFSLNNKKFLHGIVIKAKEGINKKPQIILPKIPSDSLVILPKDIIGSNIIEFQKHNIPLFASSYISYIGQPLYAVFAPTLEKAEILSSKVKIKYLENTEEDTLNNKEDITIEYQKGSYEKLYDQIIENNKQNVESKEKTTIKRYKSFYSKINFNRLSSPPTKTTKITVEIENKTLNIYSPTQWPALISSNVSKICGFNKKKIVIHKEKTYSLKDEFLIPPAILSSIAALAAIKTNKIIFIHENIETSRAKIQIEKETWYEEETQKTTIEKINVVIDQGATSILHKEFSNQLLAGLIPLYNLKGIYIKFTFTHSSNIPANFYGGLGFENALAATQIHTSRLGKSLNISPFLWINKSFYESTIYKKIIDTKNNIQIPKETLIALVDESFYNRKYSAYKVNSSNDKNFSTFTPYARGIGIAIGPSISGFSSSNETFSSPKVKLTLTFDGTIEINTSFYNSSRASEIWKSIASKELDIDKNKIEFCSNSSEIIDSGPCALSTNSKIMSEQIKQACDKINQKRFKEGLPISVTLNSKRKSTTKPLFSTESWISIVLEVSIDPISLEPIVFGVTAICSLGTLINKKTYINNMKIEILNTINELGAKTAKGNKFNLNIIINQNGENISDSISSGLRGVIYAAFNSAIEMALDSKNENLPITSDKILEKMRSDS